MASNARPRLLDAYGPAMELVSRLAVDEMCGVSHRYTALCNDLETGEIDPAGCLRGLSPTDADLVRRLALGLLIAFRESLEDVLGDAKP